MRFICIAALLIAPSLYGNVMAADTIRFIPKTENTQFDGRRVYRSADGVLIGYVGDLIGIESGINSFYINTLHEHKVRIELKKTNQGMEISFSTVLATNCRYNWQTHWPTPRTSWEKAERVHYVHLPDVQFMKRKPSEFCPTIGKIWLSRPLHSMSISVDSDPRGAKIELDGTDTRLSTPISSYTVSYGDYKKELSLLLRKKGWVNCNLVFSVSNNATKKLHCKLQRP